MTNSAPNVTEVDCHLVAIRQHNGSSSDHDWGIGVMMNESDIGGMEPYSGSSWLCAPPVWKFYAEGLKDASVLLFQRVEQDLESLRRGETAGHVFHAMVVPAAALLAGLAIENLLKGIIVIDHPEYVNQGRLQGRVIKSHNLTRLASEARVILTDQERVLCEMGTSAIGSWGRYAIARTMDKQKGFVHLQVHNYREAFENLFDRLAEILDERSSAEAAP
jgi:hypothetical protein